MKCRCGAKTIAKETRSNDYHVYRRRICPVCNEEFVTEESRINYDEGIKIIRKIFYNKYIKKRPKKKTRRGRRLG